MSSGLILRVDFREWPSSGMMNVMSWATLLLVRRSEA